MILTKNPFTIYPLPTPWNKHYILIQFSLSTLEHYILTTHTKANLHLPLINHIERTLHQLTHNDAHRLSEHTLDATDRPSGSIQFYKVIRESFSISPKQRSWGIIVLVRMEMMVKVKRIVVIVFVIVVGYQQINIYAKHAGVLILFICISIYLYIWNVQ